MSKGTAALIRLLGIISISAIILVTALMVSLGYSGTDSGVDVFWDSFATIINAWLPFYDDGEGEIAYLIIMSIAGVIGLFHHQCIDRYCFNRH